MGSVERLHICLQDFLSREFCVRLLLPLLRGNLLQWEEPRLQARHLGVSVGPRVGVT